MTKPTMVPPTTHRNLSTTPKPNQTNIATTVSPTRTMDEYKIINSNNSEASTAFSNASDWNNRTSTLVPSTLGKKTQTREVISLVPILTLATAGPIWKPAVTECTHIVSTYVVPKVLHFMAFLIGFYMFRIQENEGLHALIEKVFLFFFVYVSGTRYLETSYLVSQSCVNLPFLNSSITVSFFQVFLLSSVPKKIVSRLRYVLSYMYKVLFSRRNYGSGTVSYAI